MPTSQGHVAPAARASRDADEERARHREDRRQRRRHRDECKRRVRALEQEVQSLEAAGQGTAAAERELRRARGQLMIAKQRVETGEIAQKANRYMALLRQLPPEQRRRFRCSAFGAMLRNPQFRQAHAAAVRALPPDTAAGHERHGARQRGVGRQRRRAARRGAGPRSGSDPGEGDPEPKTDPYGALAGRGA